MSWLQKNNFLIRKVHSLLGIFPVGVFLIEHLVTNAFALQGAQVYNEKVEWIHGLPYLIWLEVFGIFLPILAHALLGVVFLWAWSDNSARYRYARNWMYTLQRITGMIGFVFICYHLYDFRFRTFFTGEELHVTFKTVAETLQNPWVFWGYVIGVVSICYHFANGIWSFVVHWGIVIGPRAQRIAGIICLGAGLTLAYIGVDSLNAFTKDRTPSKEHSQSEKEHGH